MSNNNFEQFNNGETDEATKDRQFEAQLENWQFEARPAFQENLRQRLNRQITSQTTRQKGVGGWWARRSNFDRFRIVASGFAVASLAIFFAIYLSLSLNTTITQPTQSVVALREFYDPQTQTTLSQQDATAAIGYQPRQPAYLPPGYKLDSANLTDNFTLGNKAKGRNVQIKVTHVDPQKADDAQAKGQRLEIYQFQWPFDSKTNGNNDETSSNFTVLGARRSPQQVQGVSGYLIEGGVWAAGSGNFPLLTANSGRDGFPAFWQAIDRERTNLPPNMPPNKNMPSPRPNPRPANAEQNAVVLATLNLDNPKGTDIKAAFVVTSPGLPQQTKTLLWQKDGLLFAVVSTGDLSTDELVRVAESVK